MGNFLDTPIVDKETSIGDDQRTGLTYGVSAMQGWRAQMEDDHLHVLGVPQAPDISIFGVYDGHGGDMVAHYTAKHFLTHLYKEMPYDHTAADFVAKSQQAFEVAVMALDAELKGLSVVESGQDQSGSTSVMTLVSPRHVICANTGDSRAVLSRSGQAVALSHDHKPFNPGEKERIENAGGTVKFNRVNGDLAVSRALGDFVYKRCDTVEAKEQAVTAFPEVIIEQRVPEEDEFIVLACDGIWDVMSSQEVVDKVHDMLRNGRPQEEPVQARAADSGTADESEMETAPAAPQRPWDLGAMCEALIDHCLKLGSRDNMSVIIVTLHPRFNPKPEADS
uniref:PPM-type phosphatase domain-containing protein n=1 Tax=Coccolithus braarudii TaxID=221442 RepID=A0A7S0LP81_9EUKA|mmetsp:Transcript_51284/g.109589  ORF Transcript_51284/g.109589 Transcript_51284/m.109589 type:complete len:336 (+) Transcript_51284:100-1107(+)